MQKTIEKDGIVFKKTRIPEHQHECDSCDYGHKYGRKDFCKNYTTATDGCKSNYHYKIKENSMKKSELSFKCVVPNESAELKIKKLLSINPVNITKNPFMCCTGGDYSLTSSAEYFDNWPEPLMSYEDALKLSESVEPDAPEFDIKFSEKCLGRNNIDASWKVVSFGAAGNQAFATLENGSISMVTPLTRDTFLNKNNIAGWWECENGKPVWKTK